MIVPNDPHLVSLGASQLMLRLLSMNEEELRQAIVDNTHVTHAPFATEEDVEKWALRKEMLR